MVLTHQVCCIKCNLHRVCCQGKEFETRLREKKPGNLSDELRTALGMPIGAGAERFPPPWLIAMQRYGPPPSYPNLKIPGLNAPIPEGCSFGYHAGRVHCLVYCVYFSHQLVDYTVSVCLFWSSTWLWL